MVLLQNHNRGAAEAEKIAVIWRQALAHPDHKIGGEPDWIQGDEWLSVAVSRRFFTASLVSWVGSIT